MLNDKYNGTYNQFFTKKHFWYVRVFCQCVIWSWRSRKARKGVWQCRKWQPDL